MVSIEKFYIPIEEENYNVMYELYVRYISKLFFWRSSVCIQVGTNLKLKQQQQRNKKWRSLRPVIKKPILATSRKRDSIRSPFRQCL